LPEDGSDPEIGVIIQSFEFTALKYWKSISNLPLVYLFHYPSAENWDLIAETVHGVGPASMWLMNPFDSTQEDGGVGSLEVFNFKDTEDVEKPSQFVVDMHSRGLAVHPWTLRDDQLIYESTAFDETQLYVDLGVDGIFTEFPHATFSLFQHMGSKADFPSAEKSDNTKLVEKYLKGFTFPFTFSMI
jgi:glycerophosphoryl diester phosphodiesterase